MDAVVQRWGAEVVIQRLSGFESRHHHIRQHQEVVLVEGDQPATDGINARGDQGVSEARAMAAAR
jgi:hypothetical protein